MFALTKVARRELYHTRSPLKVAFSVPCGVLKSTLDCVDGYHGVEIAVGWLAGIILVEFHI